MVAGRIEKGDILTVRVMARSFSENTDVLVCTSIGGIREFTIPREDILKIEKDPLKIGDKVDEINCNGKINPGWIRGIYGTKAWVEWSFPGEESIWDLDKLKRVP